jgi:UDP-N-acetylglucosamine transferase subunit ALG13
VIFATVGTQLPFDRLTRALDEWAAEHDGVEVFAQIGPSEYRPTHLRYEGFLSPSKTNELMRSAELIVSHAGMGTILSAMQLQKPILIMPRKANLGEHRNDHQMATARWLAGRDGMAIAWEAEELGRLLDRRTDIRAGAPLPDLARGPLVERLTSYIASL